MYVIAILINYTLAIGPVLHGRSRRPLHRAQLGHPHGQGLVRPEVCEGIRVLNNGKRYVRVVHTWIAFHSDEHVS